MKDILKAYIRYYEHLLRMNHSPLADYYFKGKKEICETLLSYAEDGEIKDEAIIPYLKGEK